jgi:hypothetical protein
MSTSRVDANAEGGASAGEDESLRRLGEGQPVADQIFEGIFPLGIEKGDGLLQLQGRVVVYAAERELPPDHLLHEERHGPAGEDGADQYGSAADSQ